MAWGSSCSVIMYGDASDRQLMNRPFSATRSRLTPNDIMAEVSARTYMSHFLLSA